MKYLAYPEKRNVTFNGKRTSLQLERYIWQNLGRVSKLIHLDESEILSHIWHYKKSMGMAPAVRLFLSYFYSSYVVSLRHQRYIGASDHAPETAQDKTSMITAEESPSAYIGQEMDCYRRALDALYDIAT